jgi:acylphosphatase
MKSVHVIITGRVQGVYFRAATQKKAKELGLVGWVRNAPTGAVEAVFAGEEEKISAMIAWCHQGPPAAQVLKVDCRERPWQGEFTDFTIR